MRKPNRDASVLAIARSMRAFDARLSEREVRAIAETIAERRKLARTIVAAGTLANGDDLAGVVRVGES